MRHLRMLCMASLGGAVSAIGVVGEVRSLAGRCLQTSQAEGGKGATVEAKKIVVWDADAPCGDGLSYIHYAPTAGAFMPMTAGAGPGVHTYRAAAIESYNDYGALTGRCAPTPVGGTGEISWQVANLDRGGSCPGAGGASGDL